MITKELKLAIKDIMGAGKYNELSTANRILLKKQDYDDNNIYHYRIDMFEDTTDILLYYTSLGLDKMIKNELNLIVSKLLSIRPDAHYKTIDLTCRDDGNIMIKNKWVYEYGTESADITYQCPSELLTSISVQELLDSAKNNDMPCTRIRVSDY